jgi:hypothetical protein
MIRMIKLRMRWVGHVAGMGKDKKKKRAYRLLAGRRLLGRQIHRWVERWDGVAWTGLVWPMIGTDGELVRIWYRTFGFHKMLGNY